MYFMQVDIMIIVGLVAIENGFGLDHLDVSRKSSFQFRVRPIPSPIVGSSFSLPAIELNTES